LRTLNRFLALGALSHLDIDILIFEYFLIETFLAAHVLSETKHHWTIFCLVVLLVAKRTNKIEYILEVLVHEVTAHLIIKANID
jgi:hypothetical protein